MNHFMVAQITPNRNSRTCPYHRVPKRVIKIARYSIQVGIVR